MPRRALDGMTPADLDVLVEGWTAGWPATARAGVLGNFVERPDGTVRARLLREHHRSILSSLWRGDPRTLYPLVPVPVALLVAGHEAGGTSAEDAAKVAAVQEAASELSDATVRWFPGAHHDVHAQRPGDVARELLVLEGRIASRS